MKLPSPPRCVLGIESSCDETSVALLGADGRVLSSVISSQIAAHRRYGGVVPEIAARAHLQNLPLLLDEALAAAGVALSDVGAVAATAGPGLVGALLVGLSEGKGIALGLGVPFVVAGLAFDWMSAELKVVKRHYRAIQVAAGLLLVVFGVLMYFLNRQGHI